MKLGTVLITGGTGSFGRAFIAYVLKNNLSEKIISMSRNAEMRYKLEQDFPDARLAVVPGDVRQLEDLHRCYSGTVDVMIHAAAEKHILTGEHHAHYVKDINVGGAKNVVAYAIESGVKCLIALSTDKACSPINEYGKSKASAEQIVVNAGYTCVRYGNVAGSSGSVIPLFLKQQQSGEITVTDRNMTRFHMPLSPDSEMQVYDGAEKVMSAVDLVLYAIKNSIGAEIFVPQIPSSTIGDLANAFAGCTIKEIGIRAGEKMHEDLISKAEANRCWITDDGVYVIERSHLIKRQNATRVSPRGNRAGDERFCYRSSDNPRLLQIVKQ